MSKDGCTQTGIAATRGRTALGVVATAAALALIAASPAGAATTRYASPTGTGVDPTCPSADPCDLKTAITDASDGDEVIVEPGPPDYVLTSMIGTKKMIDVHGASGGARPVIDAAAPSEAIGLGGPTGTKLRDLEIDQTGSGGIALGGGAVGDQLLVRSSSKAACLLFAGALIRDSACVATGPGGYGVALVSDGDLTVTASLRNVTTTANAANGVGVLAYADTSNADVTLSATNVIANGAGTDVEAQTEPGTVGSTVNLDHSNYDTTFEDTPDPVGIPAVVTPAGTATNQEAAPRLAADGYHELTGSPTIDAGTSSDPLGQAGSADVDGQARVQGGGVDIGADELVPSTPGGGGGGAPPDNNFTIGKAKKKKVSVTVPGPGEIDVKDAAAAKKKKKKKLLLKPSSATASDAETVQVPLKLTKTAKKKLKRKHKVKVKAAITFTPAGGSANAQSKGLKVKR